MKIVVIGATGHTGTYLIPQLVNAGHEVTAISRNQRKPYRKDSLWNAVKHITIDRDEAEKKGLFGKQIKDLKADVVIDLICFTAASAATIAEALLGSVAHFLHCGTMWVHGHSEQVPTTENQERKPFGEYGIRKAEIESYLLSLSKEKRFPVTILHPGHITGPGWLPINPTGNLDPQIFIRLMKGEEILLPNIGMETLHHVHASDVAQAFVKAIENRERAIGESFHIVSEQALTLRGYADAVAAWSGKKANLKFLPWNEWKKTVSEKDSALTWDHIAHSPNGSIAKAKKLLNYQPAYTSLQAVKEAVEHLVSTEYWVN